MSLFPPLPSKSLSHKYTSIIDPESITLDDKLSLTVGNQLYPDVLFPFHHSSFTSVLFPGLLPDAWSPHDDKGVDSSIQSNISDDIEHISLSHFINKLETSHIIHYVDMMAYELSPYFPSLSPSSIRLLLLRYIQTIGSLESDNLPDIPTLVNLISHANLALSTQLPSQFDTSIPSHISHMYSSVKSYQLLYQSIINHDPSSLDSISPLSPLKSSPYINIIASDHSNILHRIHSRSLLDHSGCFGLALGSTSYEPFFRPLSSLYISSALHNDSTISSLQSMPILPSLLYTDISLYDANIPVGSDAVTDLVLQTELSHHTLFRLVESNNMYLSNQTSSSSLSLSSLRSQHDNESEQAVLLSSPSPSRPYLSVIGRSLAASTNSSSPLTALGSNVSSVSSSSSYTPLPPPFLTESVSPILTTLGTNLFYRLYQLLQLDTLLPFSPILSYLRQSIPLPLTQQSMRNILLSIRQRHSEIIFQPKGIVHTKAIVGMKHNIDALRCTYNTYINVINTISNKHVDTNNNNNNTPSTTTQTATISSLSLTSLDDGVDIMSSALLSALSSFPSINLPNILNGPSDQSLATCSLWTQQPLALSQPNLQQYPLSSIPECLTSPQCIFHSASCQSDTNATINEASSPYCPHPSLSPSDYLAMISPVHTLWELQRVNDLHLRLESLRSNDIQHRQQQHNTTTTTTNAPITPSYIPKMLTITPKIIIMKAPSSLSLLHHIFFSKHLMPSSSITGPYIPFSHDTKQWCPLTITTPLIFQYNPLLPDLDYSFISTPQTPLLVDKQSQSSPESMAPSSTTVPSHPSQPQYESSIGTRSITWHNIDSTSLTCLTFHKGQHRQYIQEQILKQQNATVTEEAAVVASSSESIVGDHEQCSNNNNDDDIDTRLLLQPETYARLKSTIEIIHNPHVYPVQYVVSNKRFKMISRDLSLSSQSRQQQQKPQRGKKSRGDSTPQQDPDNTSNNQSLDSDMLPHHITLQPHTIYLAIPIHSLAKYQQPSSKSSTVPSDKQQPHQQQQQWTLDPTRVSYYVIMSIGLSYSGALVQDHINISSRINYTKSNTLMPPQPQQQQQSNKDDELSTIVQSLSSSSSSSIVSHPDMYNHTLYALSSWLPLNAGLHQISTLTKISSCILSQSSSSSADDEVPSPSSQNVVSKNSLGLFSFLYSMQHSSVLPKTNNIQQQQQQRSLPLSSSKTCTFMITPSSSLSIESPAQRISTLNGSPDEVLGDTNPLGTDLTIYAPYNKDILKNNNTSSSSSSSKDDTKQTSRSVVPLYSTGYALISDAMSQAIQSIAPLSSLSPSTSSSVSDLLSYLNPLCVAQHALSLPRFHICHHTALSLQQQYVNTVFPTPHTDNNTNIHPLSPSSMPLQCTCFSSLHALTMLQHGLPVNTSAPLSSPSSSPSSTSSISDLLLPLPGLITAPISLYAASCLVSTLDSTSALESLTSMMNIESHTMSNNAIQSLLPLIDTGKQSIPLQYTSLLDVLSNTYGLKLADHTTPQHKLSTRQSRIISYESPSSSSSSSSLDGYSIDNISLYKAESILSTDSTISSLDTTSVTSLSEAHNKLYFPGSPSALTLTSPRGSFLKNAFRSTLISHNIIPFHLSLIPVISAVQQYLALTHSLSRSLEITSQLGTYLASSSQPSNSCTLIQLDQYTGTTMQSSQQVPLSQLSSRKDNGELLPSQTLPNYITSLPLDDTIKYTRELDVSPSRKLSAAWSPSPIHDSTEMVVDTYNQLSELDLALYMLTTPHLRTTTSVALNGLPPHAMTSPPSSSLVLYQYPLASFQTGRPDTAQIQRTITKRLDQFNQYMTALNSVHLLVPSVSLLPSTLYHLYDDGQTNQNNLSLLHTQQQPQQQSQKHTQQSQQKVPPPPLLLNQDLLNSLTPLQLSDIRRINLNTSQLLSSLYIEHRTEQYDMINALIGYDDDDNNDNITSDNDNNTHIYTKSRLSTHVLSSLSHIDEDIISVLSDTILPTHALADNNSYSTLVKTLQKTHPSSLPILRSMLSFYGPEYVKYILGASSASNILSSIVPPALTVVMSSLKSAPPAFPAMQIPSSYLFDNVTFTIKENDYHHVPMNPAILNLHGDFLIFNTALTPILESVDPSTVQSITQLQDWCQSSSPSSSSSSLIPSTHPPVSLISSTVIRPQLSQKRAQSILASCQMANRTILTALYAGLGYVDSDGFMIALAKSTRCITPISYQYTHSRIISLVSKIIKQQQQQQQQQQHLQQQHHTSTTTYPLLSHLITTTSHSNSLHSITSQIQSKIQSCIRSINIYSSMVTKLIQNTVSSSSQPSSTYIKTLIEQSTRLTLRCNWDLPACVELLSITHHGSSWVSHVLSLVYQLQNNGNDPLHHATQSNDLVYNNSTNTHPNTIHDNNTNISLSSSSSLSTTAALNTLAEYISNGIFSTMELYQGEILIAVDIVHWCYPNVYVASRGNRKVDDGKCIITIPQVISDQQQSSIEVATPTLSPSTTTDTISPSTTTLTTPTTITTTATTTTTLTCTIPSLSNSGFILSFLSSQYASHHGYLFYDYGGAGPSLSMRYKYSIAQPEYDLAALIRVNSKIQSYYPIYQQIKKDSTAAMTQQQQQQQPEQQQQQQLHVSNTDNNNNKIVQNIPNTSPHCPYYHPEPSHPSMATLAASSITSSPITSSFQTSLFTPPCSSDCINRRKIPCIARCVLLWDIAPHNLIFSSTSSPL